MKRTMMAIVVGAFLLPTANAQTVIYAYDNLTGTNRLIRFGVSTPGDVTVIGSSTINGCLFSALDYAGVSGGLYAYCQEGSPGLYSVDPDTGQATFIGGGGTGTHIITDFSWNREKIKMLGLAFGEGLNYIYRVNLETGMASLIGNITGMTPGAVAVGLSADAAGILYVQDLLTDQMYKLGGDSGLEATLLGPIGPDTSFSQGMTIDWSRDGTWYLGAVTVDTGNEAKLYTIDLVTGAGTLVGYIGPGPLSFETGDIAIQPVPEPASMLALGAGLAALVARKRRRA